MTGWQWEVWGAGVSERNWQMFHRGAESQLYLGILQICLLEKYVNQTEETACTEAQRQNPGLFKFSMYDLSTEGNSRKGNAGLGPDSKGIFKKTFNYRNQSLVFFLVWHITQNDDVKQKCQREY